jgi:hypothetical protein
LVSLSNPENQTESAQGAWETITKDRENKPAPSKLNFWIVISLPSKDFSGSIKWHESAEMLVPEPGTGKLLGIAKTIPELNQMISEDEKNVHLTYRAKLQGREDWSKLLNFLAENKMLEKDV